MKVVIPSMDDKGLDSEVCEHFGNSEYYTIIEINKELPPPRKIMKNLFKDEECSIKIVKNDRTEGHACEMPVNLIVEQNVDYLLTSGIGGTPFGLFQQVGIKLYTGALGTVREALRDFLCGMLMQMRTASCIGNCGHHHN
ncbi:MAG: NifB/NifX family molybdenum-iron cluster-binding protein [Candidatus Helarchaeota archaeon]